MTLNRQSVLPLTQLLHLRVFIAHIPYADRLAECMTEVAGEQGQSEG